MGDWLEHIYSQEIKWLNYKEIDKIVHKHLEADETEKQRTKEELLKQFHKYFMKYTSLLKGTITRIDTYDTALFLSLFLSGQKSRSDLFGIYKYITYICRPLSSTDIYNELVIMFLELLDKFKFYSKVSFSRYITQYMRWSIKAWIMQLSRNPLHQSPIEYQIYNIEEGQFTINPELPELDLAWVNEATGSLFSILTRYERFLLYLSFKEGLGIRQISERLGRAKDTIHMHLQQALQKLREHSKKGV